MVYIKSDPKQTFLLPTDLRTIIPKNHICYLIENIVDQLDFSEFDKKVEGPGNPSYHPKVQLKIIINGICDRVTSTRKLEKLTYENIIFRYLSENLNPDFHTIAMFRKNNSLLIKQCFLQTIQVADGLNMVNFNRLYLDGIKLKANASKSQNFSKEDIEKLSDFVDKHLEEMDKTDAEEDIEFGESNGEPRIPDDLTNKRKLREKVKEMLKDMDKAKKQLDMAKMKIEQDNALKVNLTDMSSKLMKMKKGNHFEQAYNCQLLIEDKGEMIVGNHISDSPVDVTETVPTMTKFKQEQKLDLKGTEIFQDNGYASSNTAEYYENEGAIAYIPDQVTTKELQGKSENISRFHVDNFELDSRKNQVICPAGQIMNFLRKRKIKRNGFDKCTNVYRTDRCPECRYKAECFKSKTQKYRFIEINPHMRKIRLRFKTKKGVEKYNKRFHKGEIAQAHIQHNLSYREFKMRTEKSCEIELNLVSIAYNLRKIYNKLNRANKNLHISIKELAFSIIPEYYLG